MQNTKDTQSRNQPQQDNQSKDELQCHGVSAQVVGKSLNVNENDVRDQNRPGAEAVKDGQKCHEDSADVVGNSLHVNENDESGPTPTTRIDFWRVLSRQTSSGWKVLETSHR